MPKADLSRDYYADLELPPTADVTEIKKQFRKLALKYHPDRNPGKESEVNHKFQIIQSAHEILTNPEQKARYDGHRARTTRHPTASGVRGNPWQDVGNMWPQPPTRRPAGTTRASATASRYASWATPPKTSRDDATDHARAWDRMRPGANSRPGQEPSGPSGTSAYQGTGRRTANRPTAPPPVPPRTEAQRKKAEASFGNRRTNFSQAVPDEPPAPSSNYSSARRPGNIFNEANAQAQPSRPVPPRPGPDPIDPLSRQFQETFVDGRQRTPYSAHGGEKFNPFDGTNISRGKSMRDHARTGQTPTSSRPSSPGQRRRSASVPDETDNVRQESSSRAGDRYTPRGTNAANSPSPGMNVPNTSTNGARAPGNEDTTGKETNGGNVYGNPSSSSSFKQFRPQTPHPHGYAPQRDHRRAQVNPRPIDLLARDYPSGPSQAGRDSESFDEMLLRQLQGLINDRKRPFRYQPAAQQTNLQRNPSSMKHTDKNPSTSFNFSVDDDTFKTTNQPPQQRFSRKSADSINTRFVADEFAGSDWKFNAGSANEDAFLAAKQRHQARARQGRQSPAKTSSLNFNNGSNSEPQPQPQPQPKSGFDPEQWSEKIGPEVFVPQPPRNLSTSPSKANRPIKKAKPVRMTAGTAGLVDEGESSSSEDKTRPATAAADYAIPPTPPATTESPVAMDIDTPPLEPPKPTPQSSVARNIPVEPSKPEWRAGNVEGAKVDAKTAAPKVPTHLDIDPNRMGSEDSEAFLGPDLFADFKNVAPFAPPVASGGLGSLGDLATNLPFESKPAPQVTLEETEKEPTKPLPFPVCPKSPHPPPVLAISNLKPSVEAWKNYVRGFHTYLEQWSDFNALVTAHFEARRRLIEHSRKNTGFSWVESRDDAGIKKYLQWLEEDKIVRQKWVAACDVHEMRVREFLKYKEKMLQ